MNGFDHFPLSRKTIDLLRELREEILRLESERACFSQLSAACRLSSLEAYNERIRVRRELLSLLDESAHKPTRQ